MYTIKRMPEFDEWLAGIKDTMTRIRLGVRLDKAQRGLLGDIKPVGGGVIEMREFFGPGWRMYYVEQNGVLIVMLGGGTKVSAEQVPCGVRSAGLWRSAALNLLPIASYWLRSSPCIPSRSGRRTSARTHSALP